jgi:hypothetical protein
MHTASVLLDSRAVAVIVLIFVVGALLGVLIGGIVCVRYLRHEVAADIGPSMRRMQSQLDNLETAVNLALVTRYAELAERPHHDRIEGR